MLLQPLCWIYSRYAGCCSLCMDYCRRRIGYCSLVMGCCKHHLGCYSLYMGCAGTMGAFADTVWVTKAVTRDISASAWAVKELCGLTHHLRELLQVMCELLQTLCGLLQELCGMCSFYEGCHMVCSSLFVGCNNLLP